MCNRFNVTFVTMGQMQSTEQEFQVKPLDRIEVELLYISGIATLNLRIVVAVPVLMQFCVLGD